MKKTLTLSLAGLAAIAASCLVTAPAKADTFGGVTCTTVDSASHTYPADNVHYLECIPSPTTQQMNNWKAHYGAIQGFFHDTTGGNAGARDKLLSAGVTFYYFATREDYNSYMDAKFSTAFDAGTARCGNTHSQLGTIVSAVFDKCHYSTGTVVANANPSEVGKHEGGHAWSAALGKLNSTSGPARSTGFNTLVSTQTLAAQDTHWTGLTTQALKDSYICGLFKQPSPSTLELDLGSSSGPVCTGNTNNYPTKKPSEIAADKMPYFVTTAGTALYEEWWAEVTVLVAGGAGSPELLPITNNYFSDSGTSCSRYGMDYYWTHGVAPPQATYPTGCAGVDPNTFK